MFFWICILLLILLKDHLKDAIFPHMLAKEMEQSGMSMLQEDVYHRAFSCSRETFNSIVLRPQCRFIRTEVLTKFSIEGSAKPPPHLTYTAAGAAHKMTPPPLYKYY